MNPQKLRGEYSETAIVDRPSVAAARKVKRHSNDLCFFLTIRG